jgi:transposase-like protein
VTFPDTGLGEGGLREDAGMEFPKTLLEFEGRFPDEEACWETLRAARGPRGFSCPRCGHEASTFVSTRRLEQCRSCRYQCSVTAGTVFHRTKVPLRTWFWAIFFVARHKQGISALQLQKDLGLGSYETAWTMLHKLRSGLSPRPAFRLHGLVEADDTYVGGPEPGRRGGRQAGTKTIVVAAVERHPSSAGQLRLSVVQGLQYERDLRPFLTRVLEARATTLRTDGYASYPRVEEDGIRHDRQIQGDPARGGEILPWCHIVFGNLKNWLRGTFHGVSGKHLQRYLHEFVDRFDRRWREAELFGFVLRRAVRAEPLPYSRLVAELAG